MQWVHPENREYVKSTNPSRNTFLAETIQGTAEDVNVAVAAAKEVSEPEGVRGNTRTRARV
jgi:acyl-CoA reductase-like NAD-dependent aldehyde dehydrogenase